MDNSILVPALFGVTFLIALIYGVMQFFKAKKAREEHHHSATEKQQMEGTRSGSSVRS